MFEAHVLYLLRQHLGEYVHGLSAEALQISVWKGDVVLKDLQLKAEALNSLKLPLTVKAGFLGSVTIKVPWNRLGNEPVVVLLDRIFILAVPEDERSFEKEDKEKLVEAKRRQIEEAELTTLEAKKRKITKSEDSTERSSWLGSLIATIIGNLKISITNVHIRYEDSSSNPGKPFCAGITLSKLAAVTIDDNGMETFVATGALDRLRKSLQLQSFAIYFDSNCEPWKLQKNWEEMTPQEWSEIFKISTDSSLKDDQTSTSHSSQHQYLLRPVNGMLRYHRCGKQEKRASDVAFQNISLVLNDLSLTVSEGQYCDVLKLLERVSRYKTRIEFSNFRPQVSVQSNARAWWLYACQAEMQKQKKMWNRLSWKKILHLCQLRRRYVHLYVNILLQNGKADIQMLHEIETELDGKIILLWRLLAHAKVESLKSKVSMAQHENTKKSTWWPFGWGSATESSMQSSNTGSNTHDELSEPGHLTKEEWNKINELLSYQPGADSPFTSINEGPNMLQLLFEATVTTSAVRIINNQGLEVICGAFRNLNIGLKLYEKTTECNLKLQFYGLSAPEGCLIESISREGKEQALTGTFIHHPLNENLDWRLSASVSPCHVTVFMISFERFMQFLRSGHSVSPDIALETATALQNKLEKVTRRAQEQLQLALEEQSRFIVDLDLDAPKIRIPICKDDSAEQTSQLLLDLGHFTLRTADDEYTKDNLYSCFYISGKEMAAFFVDGVFEWSDIQNTALCNASENPDVTQKSKKLFLPVLDPCKMSIMIAKLGIPHASYPQNSVVIEVPNLCFHFSPSRYSKLLQLLSVFDGSNGPKNALGPTEKVETLPSWHPADHAGKAKVLCWKGLGNTVAEWQQCWCVLTGLYLYILESENAQTYQRYTSLSGKQVIEIPASSIGGSEFVIVVCNRSVDLQKALESSSTIVLQFKDEDCKMAWMNYIISVIYRASAHSSLSLPETLFSDEDHDKSSQHANQEQALFFLTGSLHSLKVPIYVSMRDESLGVHDETRIIELQAGGAKVHLVQWECDLTIGMKLHTFKIEDKLQGGVAPSCKYLARSLLGKVDIYTTEAENAEEETENYSNSSFAETNTDEDGSFKDAVSDFGIVPEFTSSPGSHLKSDWASLMKEYSALRTSGATGYFQSVVESSEVNSSDFVSMRLIMSQIDSPNYDGVDTQISMHMATLDFFCNRPTVVALIDFGTDLSEIVGSESEQMAFPSVNSEGNDIVKGLLGTGKSRVVFLLTMNVNSVRIFLNKEDGSQLAMLAQESFLMDLKVFPASFTIDGSLGNLRVCDMSLGPVHQWGWFCDIRDPGCDSLVKVHFKSYSDDENDYQGFDYSLCGKFSAVRIVFLYRFIQEITVYFTALASPQTQKAIRVVDKVGGIEKFILLSDIDGSPAVKLDISLDTPIFVMPRHSASNEFMQLDLGHLQLVNSFIWCGGEKDVASAVHLDVLLAEITGINMVVGIDGVSGKNMIQEARGLHVKITRPLRDLFKKVPDLQVEVQVEMVKGIMSDKEYLVITECASSNIAEIPNLPPYFRNIIEPYSGHNESLEAMEATSTDKKDPLSTWTVNRFIVEVEHAELQLYTGVDQDVALACVKLEGLWLGYRSTSTLETDLYVTLPKISVLDLRTDTKPEMRLMLGPMSDIEKEETLLMTTNDHMSPVSDNTVHHVAAVPHVSMLIMDLRSKPDSQEFVLRIQCPRLLVVVDFLLDVTDFFVPTLGPTTGKQEAANVQNDPFFSHRHVRLNQSLYRQQEAEVTFSDAQKLIVDAAEVDDYIYDGCGGVMYLDIPELTSSAAIHKVQSIIMIGPGKKLCFKNITIKNGLRMQEIVQLSCNSAYSVSPGDGVKLEGSIYHSKAEEKSVNMTDEPNAYSSSLKNPENISSQGPINFIFDIQAVAPELTFYDSAKWSSPNFSRQERLLRARMDLNALYAHKGNDKWIRIFVKGLSIEGGSGLVIVDPLDITAEYACVKDKTSIVLSTSDINIRLSFTLIRLMLHLHHDVVSKFQFGGFQAVAKCTHFDQIWINNSGQKVAFWRPKPPQGYAILGDCITSGGGSPSQAVMAVNKIYNRVKRPTHFELIWCFNSDVSSTMKEHDDGSDICCIWRPVPAPGYVAIGCIAHLGIAAPLLSTVYCIRSDLLTSASINDCVFYLLPQPGDGKKALSIWRVDNIAGSFFAHQSTGVPSKASLFDLNQMMHQGVKSASRDHDQYKPDDNASLWNSGERPGTSQSDIVCVPPTSGCKFATVVQCERMWWDRSNDRNPVSIWRPTPFPGYGILADQLVEGLEPPNFGLVVKNGGSGQLARPVGYVLFMQWLGKGSEDIYVWYPRAPEGYVALGCVVTKTRDTPPLDLVFCVRSNLVNTASISKQAVWSVGSRNNQNSCSIWKVENQVNSFLARPSLERPTSGMAFGLSEAGKTGSKENLIGKTKIGRLSITIYDDLNGLMTPLLNVTITGVNLAAHGYAAALSAVLLSEITASTFNTHLETWEPFIESFEAIMKYESHDEASQEIPLRTGKRVRITAPNVLNINASSANLEAFIGGYVAWRKQSDMEQQALSAIDLENCEQENSSDCSFAESALVQDNSEKLVLENRLGTNLFLRTFEHDDTNFQILGVGESTVVCLPPLKFPDKMNCFTTNMAASRQHIVIHVLEAKELPIIDDCNGQEYFCSLRFTYSYKSAKDMSVLAQTARSRCVKISDVEKLEDPSLGWAKWNEVFIFDMPQEGSANLELFVSNQAAGGGKGEVIGTILLPIKEDSAQKHPRPSSLWRNFQQSVRGAHTSATDLKGETFTLKSPKSKVTSGIAELERISYGLLTISIQLLVADSNCPATEADVMINYPSTSDVGLWVGLSPKGQWTSIRSLLPVGTISKNLSGTDMALEVTMQHDRKHAVLRSLVMFSNETDIVLEACVCPIALLNTPDENLHYSNNPKSEVDEIFENQRFQPLLGWGSKWPGHLLPTDPGRWSNCDYSNSSQSWEDLEPALTPGWITMSDWSVDKTGYVDENGWAYGLDFQSLKWPALSENSSKKPKLDFVRRRRWFRSRQHVPENNRIHSRRSLGFVEPGSSMPLPFAYTAPHTDYCLQVRPLSKSVTGSFIWGRAVGSLSGSNTLLSPSEGSQSSKRSSPRLSRSNTLTSVFMLNQLEKMEELLLCIRTEPSSTVKGHCWLSVEADVKILYNDFSSSIYDCKLSVNAPLKIENLLPCAAEYCVWEKKKEMGSSSAERGVVKPGESVYIYTVDIRQPIYATWLIQGGWKPEKDYVLISGPNLDDLPAGLSLIHQQTHRRLQIRLERDFNGSFTKSVRLFVPYWLSNKASLPLSFQLVELDSSGGSETDTPWLIRAVKDVKQAKSRSSHSQNKMVHLRRVTQYLEYIEESGGNSLMLSPQTQSSKGSFSPFSPRPGEYMLSSRLGFAVSISKFNKPTYGVSFRDLEDTQSIDLKARDTYGAYYKLSAFLDMSSARTKVINIQPHSLFVNRLGQRLCVRQHDFEHVELIYPHDPPKIFLWQDQVEEEMLSICVDGFNWSNPFSIDSEGIMHVGVNSRQDGRRLFIRAEVRSGVADSRYLVIFRHVSYSSPYRIENLSVIRPVRIRQTGGNNESWQFILTGSAIPFAWEDLYRTRSLDLLIDGEDPRNFTTYDIDTTADHQPNSTQGRPVAALHVSVFKEGTTQVVRVADWTPSDQEGSSIFPIGAPSADSPESREIQLHISVELAEFGLSIIDHTPEELLYFSFQNLIATYGTGLGSRTSRFKLRIDSIQVDNQLPLTPMPVLFRPLIQGSQGNSRDPLLKCTVTMQEQISTEHLKFSYIGIQGPPIPNIVFSININEPIIWRLHDLIQRLNMGRLQGSQTTDVALDPIVGIGFLNLSEIKLRVSLAMSPTQRPRGVLGFWSSLMTALGNTDDMPIKVTRRVREDISMRKSALIATALSAIKKDLLSNPLQLLSGVDILGNASTALGHMSKGVAALSMDKKFIQGRQKQESKASVEGFGDGFREGAEAFGKGLFRGVTGIIIKPYEGAKSSGVEGFVQGVGKGIIGAAAQPVSGVLDLLSKTTEGANAMRMKISAAITSEEQLSRRRLPRAIGSDYILCPYDEYKATGQILMQLAVRSSIFGPVDFFKVRGKYAMTDKYEDHFSLPGGKTLIITNRRAILLQHPTNQVQRQPDLLRNPCTVQWDMEWVHLTDVDLISGEDNTNDHSQLVLHSRVRPQDARIFETKDLTRIIKCCDGSQASQIYYSIDQAKENANIRGEDFTWKKVFKPYAGSKGINSEDASLLCEAVEHIPMPELATFGPPLIREGKGNS